MQAATCGECGSTKTVVHTQVVVLPDYIIGTS